MSVSDRFREGRANHDSCAWEGWDEHKNDATPYPPHDGLTGRHLAAAGAIVVSGVAAVLIFGWVIYLLVKFITGIFS